MYRPNPIAGLDLGNAWARLALYEAASDPCQGDTARVFSLPSLLVFDGDEILTGDEAQEIARARPQQAVERICSRLAHPGLAFTPGPRTFTNEELGALLIHRLGQLAGASLGCSLEEVVLAVPGCSSGKLRRALAESVRRAGLNIRDELDAPVAVARAYGLHEQGDRPGLVFNLGDSFETALVQVRQDGLRVLASNSDPSLGGPALDQAMLQYLARTYRERTGHEEDPFADEAVRRDVLAEIEAARIQLSQRERALVVVRARGWVDVELTRQILEEHTAELLDHAIRLTNGMRLYAASTHGDDGFDRILLAGGAAAMPAVAQRLLGEYGTPVECVAPETAVVRGAAQLGALLSHPGEPEESEEPAPPDPARVRIVRWRLVRGLFGRVEVVIRGDLSRAARLQLVGQVNEAPQSAAEGRCLAEWRRGPTPPGPELRLRLERWPDPQGEVFCCLFVAPEQDFVIESPAFSERVAWSR